MLMGTGERLTKNILQLRANTICPANRGMLGFEFDVFLQYSRFEAISDIQCMLLCINQSSLEIHCHLLRI